MQHTFAVWMSVKVQINILQCTCKY